MKKIVIPVLLLGVLGYLAYLKVGDVSKKVDYNITDIAINNKQTNLRQIAFILKIAISNPTDVNITFKSLNTSIIYENRTIGIIKLKQDTTVKQNSITTITVPAIIPVAKLTASVFSALTKIIVNKENPIVDISGEIEFSGGTLKVESKETLKIV